jgi:hypothetical protein
LPAYCRAMMSVPVGALSTWLLVNGELPTGVRGVQ